MQEAVSRVVFVDRCSAGPKVLNSRVHLVLMRIPSELVSSTISPLLMLFYPRKRIARPLLLITVTTKGILAENSQLAKVRNPASLSTQSC